jgi:hypothetical protein
MKDIAITILTDSSARKDTTNTVLLNEAAFQPWRDDEFAV